VRRRKALEGMMASVKMSLLTYNILRGGQGREEKIAKVIQAVDPDVVIVQEAQGVASFHRIAQALEMTACSAGCRF
jgi:endonuclease/exonuclease/phosphatase family metal-dependent hydrolase